MAESAPNRPLTLFSTLAVKGALERHILPAFVGASTGADRLEPDRAVRVHFAPTTVLLEQVEDGAAPDLLITTTSGLVGLAGRGLVHGESITPIGSRLHPATGRTTMTTDARGTPASTSPAAPPAATSSGRHHMVHADGLRWHVVLEGQGPPLVLIAGFPQSCYAWRKLSPLLAGQHTVVAVDLPGQGDSDKPDGGYDTATTAQRINALVTTLSLGRHVLVGHDIGSWVGYAYAHAFPDQLRGIALLDGNIPGVTLSPTLTLGPDNWRNWHFLFNPIPDLPEALLAGRERVLIEWFFARKAADWRTTFTRADIDEYEHVYAAPGGIRGMLGYYRALLTDMEQNAALMDTPIQVPVLALGGEVGSAPDLYERMRPLGHDVRGGVIPASGHYIPEEQPEALARELLAFTAGLDT